MPIKSEKQRYGAVAVAIHWITALAILAMLASGLSAVRAEDGAGKLALLRVHAIMGTGVGLLTVLRLVWWGLFDRRPDDVPGMPAWQEKAAHIVHGALYVVVLVMVASGFGTLILSGANQQIFGAAPLPLPDLMAVPPFTVHFILAWTLVLLLIGHIGAALYHQFVRRDHLLARMGIGR